jgi:HlyD family secretion protein
MPFIRIDITRQSRGIIRTEEENNRITSALPGRIEWINLKENQPVEKGDTLLKLNTAKIDEEINWYYGQIRKYKQYIPDLENLINGKNHFQTLLYKQNHSEYTAHLEKYHSDLENSRRDFRIHQKLHEQKVISDEKFEEKKYQYEQARNAYKAFIRQSQLEWQTRMEKLREKKRECCSKIQRLVKEKQKYIITSPINGVVTQFSGLQQNNFISPNTLIAEISPNENLLVECYLSPADIGMVRNDMKVRFQFDAFDYNQWGLGKGKVKEISNDVITMNDQPVFKVKCSLNTPELFLKNGYKGELKKGMTLTARFHITERTLFQLMYDKIDDWLNPKIKETAESYACK